VTAYQLKKLIMSVELRETMNIGEVVNLLIIRPTANAEERKQVLEELGRAISNKCNWVGEDILTVFKSALEDANYHSFNKSVSELWEEQQ
tara:strand:+ start:250 stop:519 length:270 start_codon:yes stop_codon:yes gene_type:complete